MKPTSLPPSFFLARSSRRAAFRILSANGMFWGRSRLSLRGGCFGPRAAPGVVARPSLGGFDDRAAGAFAPMLGAPLGCSQPRTWPQTPSDALERTRTRTRGLQKSAREQLKPTRAGADDPRALEREDLGVVCVGAGCRKRTRDVFNGTAMSNPKFELPRSVFCGNECKSKSGTLCVAKNAKVQ
jgi:hypothetical protein